MRCIYKQALQVTDLQTFHASPDVEVLTIQNQAGVPTIWFVTDTDREQVDHELVCFGTGHELPDLQDDDDRIFSYLATTQEANGRLIWHWFQVIRIWRSDDD